MSLYHRHRPRSLDRVIGNEGTVESLRTMLRKRTLPHTILFSGPSGCGKTTLARILVKELACSEMDFSEVNAANFRGIDTVREISRTMQLAPTGGTCRIWLLDEAHNLSKDAQTAALKILEDTPPHVYFFLATTDPGKLLSTIRSRCTEMPVRLLKDKELDTLVRHVCQRETKAERACEVSEAVLSELVGLAEGSARRALVLLDKIRNLPAKEQAASMRAKADEERASIDLCRALIKKEQWTKVAKILSGLSEDPEAVRRGVLGYARSVLLKGKNTQAYAVLLAFENDFYSSGAAGLARASFEAIFGG